MSMTDPNDQSQLLESFRAYECIDSLGLPSLDEQSSSGQDFDTFMNETLQQKDPIFGAAPLEWQNDGMFGSAPLEQQNDGMFGSAPLEQQNDGMFAAADLQQQTNDTFDAPPHEQLSQLPSHPNKKRKLSNPLDWPNDAPSEASSSMSRTTAIIVYDGKGHKRGSSFTKNLENTNNLELKGTSQPQFREADMERARLVLPLLPNLIAILRYSCGCRSPRGTCNHHTFIAGLTLPDGIICASCQTGATYKEIKTPRLCPPHRRHQYRRDRLRLRHLGHNSESVAMNCPALPDLIQDFAATQQQREICDRHLQCALLGQDSGLQGVIRSWSGVQRGWYERQRRHLARFPRIFGGREGVVEHD